MRYVESAAELDAKSQRSDACVVGYPGQLAWTETRRDPPGGRTPLRLRVTWQRPLSSHTAAA